MIDYETFTLRNNGYIGPEIQKRIRSCRLLVAGCGIGSGIAEAAVRTGFEHIVLVDADTVTPHNLNRQNFVEADVGRKKVDALADRLRAIYSAGDIKAVDSMVSKENAGTFVDSVDLVLDTIDFLDIGAIVALHDACSTKGKPIITAVSAGFGTVVAYFPPGSPHTFRDLFGIGRDEDVDNASYTEKFQRFVDRIGSVFSPEVQAALRKTLRIMEDGVPCPAPHLAIGATAVASLCTTIAVRHLAGLPCDAAPLMMTVDMARACVTASVSLLD
jgi:molybdopterin-synthase adenylyltransferase